MFKIQQVRVAAGPEIPKTSGEAWGGIVSFSHRGAPESIYVAIGLSHRHAIFTEHHTPFLYAYKLFTVDQDPDWTLYNVAIEGTMPVSLDGDFLDTLAILSYDQPVGGSSPSDKIGQDTDDDVFVFTNLPGAAFTIESVTAVNEEVTQGGIAQVSLVWRNELNVMLGLELQLGVRCHGDWYYGDFVYSSAIPGQTTTTVLSAPVKSTWPNDDVIDAKVIEELGGQVVWQESNFFHTKLIASEYKDVGGSNYQ